MRLARAFLSATSTAVLIGQLVSPVSCKELLTAEQIIENCKAGVVGISTSAASGSGFLIDDAGLILTSSDVTKDGAKNLRVKFGPEQVVEGKVLINDQDLGIAVIRVNLKNVHAFKSLQIPTTTQITTMSNDDVVVMGLNKTSEKTIAGTTVRSVQREEILLRGKMDPSNIGGPLVNLNGEVVGINFQIPSMPGQSAALPISLAAKDIADAKIDATKLEAPSDALLPDIPSSPFNVSELLKGNPDLLKNRTQKDYNFGSPDFSVSVFTPVQGYFQIAQMFASLTGTKKTTTEVSLDASELEMTKSLYDTEKPVVTIMVIPKSKLSGGAKFMNAASFLGCATAVTATCLTGIPLGSIGSYSNHKTIQKDFMDLTLTTADGSTINQPIEAKRVPYEKEAIAMTGYKFPKLDDMVYLGIYTFDSRCFETEKPLKLVVASQGKKGEESQSSILFPETLKKKIIDDFKPYWAAQSKATLAKTTPEKKTEM